MKGPKAIWGILGTALALVGCDAGSGGADAGPRVDAVVSLDSGSSADAGDGLDAGSDAGGGADAGADAEAQPVPTAEEQAACAHLATLEPGGCLPGGTETACAQALARTRRDHAEPDCLAEYDAYVACLTTASSCDTGGAGVLCPTEYSALGLCSQ